ncbi:MAG TPA: lysophospholipid acyltransferase family protein [Acidimicrobiales bacterium]|nr:lysophospholipid acyltransferase family protein [Acidimicrobiales bacterium]
MVKIHSTHGEVEPLSSAGTDDRATRRPGDWVMTRFARLLIRVFFRRVELEGGENLPPSGPVVLVANHINGLVDGLLLMATLSRYPRFLGKSTLFKVPPLWPLLKLAGVIPVFRTVDGVPGDHNVSAFATCHDLLRRGGVVAVFPEGISHDEPTLQPLKTGAARIALEAGIDGEIDGVQSIAVGLVYDAKARFRSRALVRVGEPTGIGHWAEAYRTDRREAVRAFTDDLAAQLHSVSPTYSSWAQADLLSRIAEVVVRTPGDQLPADVQLADQVSVASRLATIPEAVDGAPMQHLLTSFGAYERDLSLLGLSDSQLVAGYSRRRLRLALLWSALKVVIALPFAAIGIIVHVVPFQIMKQVAKKPTNEGVKATVKLLGCFFLFVTVYVVVGVLVGRAYGPWAGLLAALAAPLCGYAVVRLRERVQRMGGLVEGYRTVREHRDVLHSVIAHREAVTVDARRILLEP